LAGPEPRQDTRRPPCRSMSPVSPTIEPNPDWSFRYPDFSSSLQSHDSTQRLETRPSLPALPWSMLADPGASVVVMRHAPARGPSAPQRSASSEAGVVAL